MIAISFLTRRVIASLALALSLTPWGLAFTTQGTPWTLDEDGRLRLTYSYDNLLDGGLSVLEPISSFDPFTPSAPALATASELRAATQRALELWAEHAPIDFVEVSDAGPAVADRAYSGSELPNLRFGHHFLGGNPDGPDIKAHAFVPSSSIGCGLCGDVHFDNGDVFAITTPRPPESSDPAFSFLGIITHEIGHALGLGHTELTAANVSVMHPSVQFDFATIESASLFADDIQGIQSLYGVGMGTVTPLPEPSGAAGLLMASLGLVLYDPRRGFRRESTIRIDRTRGSCSHRLLSSARRRIRL